MAPTVNDSPGLERRGVVVGVDNSPMALEAVRWAGAEARLRGLPLCILHAAPYAADHTGPALRRARDILARAFTVARRAQPELPVTTRCTEDAPVRSLLEAAEHAELLVLGMGGGERLGEALIRSVALEVSGRASCPVVVVRGVSTRSGRDVVVAVDRPGADAAALEVAFADARRHGGQVVVLHALHGAGPLRDKVTGHEESSRDAALARLSDELTPWATRNCDVPVRVEVVRDQPGAALLIASVTARLVVLRARSRSAPARALFGSTSRQVLRRCGAPVVVVVNPAVAVDAASVAAAPIPAGHEQVQDPHDRSELW
jgi:nucleotide-binding universal stress UspA family protein